MFQKQLLGSSVNKQLRRRTVTVRFFREETVFNEETQLDEVQIIEDFAKDFQFSIEETVEAMKKAVNQYLDELNYVPAELTDLDYVEPTPVEVVPTAAVLARTEWEADKAKLKQIQELIDMGVFTGTEASIVTLRNKVKADFKPAYIA